MFKVVSTFVLGVDTLSGVDDDDGGLDEDDEADEDDNAMRAIDTLTSRIICLEYILIISTKVARRW